MAITVRQEKSAQGAGVASLAVTFTSTILAGSVIVAMADSDSGGGTVTSITFTDDKSDTPTDSGSGTATGANESVGPFACAAFLTPTVGAQTVTAHYSATPGTFTEVIAWEITGLTSASFDKHFSHTQTTGTPVSSGSSGTLASAAEIGLSCAFSNPGMLTGTEGAGWTEDEIAAGSSTMVQHIITASTAAITASGTQGASGSADIMVVTLQSAGDTLGGAMQTLMM